MVTGGEMGTSFCPSDESSKGPKTGNVYNWHQSKLKWHNLDLYHYQQLTWNQKKSNSFSSSNNKT